MKDSPRPRTSLLLDLHYRGDAAALGELLEGHYDWLYRQTRRFMPPALRAKEQSGDLVQEALIEFIQTTPRFRIENGRLFRAFLLRVVRNMLLERHRWWSARRRDLARERPILGDTVLELEGANEARDPAEAAADQEEEAWLRLALEFLDAEDLRVIVLRDLDRLSYAVIGEQLGKSKGAVLKHHGRAIEKLASVVKKLREGRLAELLEKTGD